MYIMPGRIYIEYIIINIKHKIFNLYKFNRRHCKNTHYNSNRNVQLQNQHNDVQNDINNGFLINDILIYRYLKALNFFKEFSFNFSSRLLYSLLHLKLVSKLKHFCLNLLEKLFIHSEFFINNHFIKYKILSLVFSKKINYNFRFSKINILKRLKINRLDFNKFTLKFNKTDKKFFILAFLINKYFIYFIKIANKMVFLSTSITNFTYLDSENYNFDINKLDFVIFDFIKKINCTKSYKIQDLQKINHFFNTSYVIMLIRKIGFKLNNPKILLSETHPFKILIKNMYNLCFF
ncbi:hypothetical protein (nucleomorph) [Guillardia theta]|uniref:Uncharacterized protein n=1 Tax=Guillardia theta TaxID=55529 RepID=Q98RZ6_GUITH|nr:hypothetical protein GTHECHR1012 [Guillardia theta]AAK39804.1 hypothetical protein [Guillardia theta]